MNKVAPVLSLRRLRSIVFMVNILIQETLPRNIDCVKGNKYIVKTKQAISFKRVDDLEFISTEQDSQVY